ncbi:MULTISPECIES: YtpI family protein [Sporosarcina]|uniref:YtpI family protein n=1 Tax=Sporosarcina TaxID=1569 RepID=UPI00058FD092|nr:MULTISPECIES: YtpI family protein [Sporosarcina]WJY27970.1 YtpI family protein [Sporosarcina sp. 0.2-SM1T-5]
MKTLNFVLVFLIIASAVFYFYFKTRQFRTSHVFPIRKKMFAAKAGMFLGVMLAVFGINQLLLFDGALTYIVSAVFILLGGYVSIFNWRATQHYNRFVDEETELNSR